VSARIPKGHVAGIIGIALTISTVALLHGSSLAVAAAVAIRLLRLLLGVGGFLGAIRVVLAVAALSVIPQALVLSVVRKRRDTSKQGRLTLMMDNGFQGNERGVVFEEDGRVKGETGEVECRKRWRWQGQNCFNCHDTDSQG
jgi:hypothetical protein